MSWPISPCKIQIRILKVKGQSDCDQSEYSKERSRSISHLQNNECCIIVTMDHHSPSTVTMEESTRGTNHYLHPPSNRPSPCDLICFGDEQCGGGGGEGEVPLQSHALLYKSSAPEYTWCTQSTWIWLSWRHARNMHMHCNLGSQTVAYMFSWVYMHACSAEKKRCGRQIAAKPVTKHLLNSVTISDNKKLMPIKLCNDQLIHTADISPVLSNQWCTPSFTVKNLTF